MRNFYHLAIVHTTLGKLFKEQNLMAKAKRHFEQALRHQRDPFYRKRLLTLLDDLGGSD